MAATISRTPILLALCVWPLLSLPIQAAQGNDPVLFSRDIMAVISKAGCNAGLCHGNANGKGGLKLSLRGESPHLDYAALKGKPGDGYVRPGDPAASLLLLKPTLQAAKGHKGGKRFEAGSPEYRALLEWIQAGAPEDPPEVPRLTALRVEPREKIVFAPEISAQLKVMAEFSDGSTRDVTRWAVYEPYDFLAEIENETGIVSADRPGETVIGVRYLHLQEAVRLAFQPHRPGFRSSAPPPANYIDELVFEKIRRLRINPSPVADDTSFVRRVFLDLLGVPPTGDEARSFVESTAPGKRAHLIDSLLARPEFADFWALKWADLLRVEEKVLDNKGVASFHGWIRQSFSGNQPLDQFVRDILTAKGSTYANPPANYYRALRTPEARAEAVAQVFLGTRLQCARCHDHPFDRWTMDDYYQFAAVFDRMDYEIIENKRADKNDKNMFIGEQVVQTNAKGALVDPRSDQPPGPRLPDAAAPPVDAGENRFDILARWMTSPENALFARVQANRIWAQLLGRGIVDPVDDFRRTNPPSNPALLEALTRDFVESGFDVRHLVRRIANSTVYQLSSSPDETNTLDAINFSHAAARRLDAEQLLDAIHQVLAIPAEFSGYDSGTRAAQVRGVNAVFRDEHPGFGDRFLNLFGKPPRLTNSDLERTSEISLAQTFELVSGPGLDSLLRRPENRLSELANSGMDTAEMMTSLYWNALSRPPTDAEREAMGLYAAQARDLRTTLEDIAWSLLNSKEFILRH